MNVEWHSPSYTPGNSDFDLPAEYSQRGSMYGVGGIPHSQWNGMEETVGGYPNANWQPMYDTFITIYNSMVDDETPYEIDINGYASETEVGFDVTVSMDADMSNSNQKVDIFVVEDHIWSYWGAVAINHHARNVVRNWVTTETLTISSNGESQTFSGTFELSNAWNPDSVQIIAVVQNYSSKQIYQVTQVNINNMNPDIDEDGVMNADDNCVEVYNPDQMDEDGDLMGDVCDPCNNNVYITGNLNGDYSLTGEPIIDAFDVLALVEFVLTDEGNECLQMTNNINGDGLVNVMDVIGLAQMILSGGN